MTSSRRTFLAGLGAAALTPFLPVLNASGQEALYPKRLLLVFTPHGAVKNAWLPSGSETSFTLSPSLAPLARHQDKLVVLGGLNMPDVGVGAPHTKGLPMLWTGSRLLDDGTFKRPDGSGGFTFGWNSAASVDQVLAARLSPPTRYRTLEFGVRAGGSAPQSRMIYSGAKQPLAPATDPWAQFTRLFTGLSDAASRERLAAVALAHGELTRLRPRIASEERSKVEAHLDALASLETRLQTRSAACKGPALAPKKDPAALDNTPLVMGCQLDLITAAFACDLTRIASLQYAFGDNDGRPYPWLGISEDHHLLTHSADSDTSAWNKVLKIRVWYAEQVALLLDKLAAIPEGDGTLLDNTMVVWGSELGVGNTHSFRSTPFVIAGGCSGAYQTGRFLQYGEKLTHNRLLVSICNAMGYDAVDTFGDADTGSGPLPGLLSG